MKLFLMLMLLTVSSVSQSAEKFGLTTFHSSVDPVHQLAIQKDLIYLYSHPIRKQDPQFKELLGTEADGPSVYNWFVNRVRYIFDQSFGNDKDDAFTVANYIFPKTVFPPRANYVQPPQVSSPSKPVVIPVIMSNFGVDAYLAGKKNGKLIGFNVDGKRVLSTSPRVGLVRIGDGLFLERKMINKDLHSEANKIARIATYIHEGRHSDGNGTSTGFTHIFCPRSHGMEYAAACEMTENGAYTIGGLTIKHFLENCSTCSLSDKAVLQARAFDQFDRVVKTSYQNKIAELKAKMIANTKIHNSYISRKDFSSSPVQKEISRLVNENQTYQKQITMLQQRLPQKKSFKLDPKPEGSWQPITLSTSNQAMEKVLGNKQ